MGVQTFKHKHAVEAIRFTADNLAEVEQFVGNIGARTFKGVTLIDIHFVDFNQGWEKQYSHVAEPGDWIVRDYQGRYEVLSDEKFAEKYELPEV